MTQEKRAGSQPTCKRVEREARLERGDRQDIEHLVLAGLGPR